jgi:hypothetical protein
MEDLEFLKEIKVEEYSAQQSQDNDFGPLPTDKWFQVSIHGCDLAQTKNGKGWMVKIRFDVFGPSHAGRVVFDQMLIKHTSETAERIGREKLCEILAAVGINSTPTSRSEFSQLVGKQLDVRFKTEKSEGYDPKSVIGRAKKHSNGSTSAPPSQSFNDSDVPF